MKISSERDIRVLLFSQTLYSFQSGNKSDPDQVSLLLEHVQRGSRSRYAAFITALVDTHQEYVVTEVLGEEAEHHDLCCTKEVRIITVHKLLIKKSNIKDKHIFCLEILQTF